MNGIAAAKRCQSALDYDVDTGCALVILGHLV
ncbi:hypothetical protein Poly41_25900 [Novipirellula artificiosorum]|uniref:Uncharacterized protein n=1 Tax=Novipirellula artificiosorum TaxID=2528016 RepID=A0A5C6DU30_9BACT|nr:hypothetical protein Poly41_25900 [Novipirellula artificiosorum]